jgi:hypothetical protein
MPGTRQEHFVRHRITGREQTGASRPSPLRAWIVACAVASLLAFVWQGFVTGAHVHPWPVTPASIAAQAGPEVLPVEASKPVLPPAECPICHAAALAGHYLPPQPIVVPIVVVSLAWGACVVLAACVHDARSHGWHSRAPPRKA